MQHGTKKTHDLWQIFIYIIRSVTKDIENAPQHEDESLFEVFNLSLHCCLGGLRTSCRHALAHENDHSFSSALILHLHLYIRKCTKKLGLHGSVRVTYKIMLNNKDTIRYTRSKTIATDSNFNALREIQN